MGTGELLVKKKKNSSKPSDEFQMLPYISAHSFHMHGQMK